MTSPFSNGGTPPAAEPGSALSSFSFSTGFAKRPSLLSRMKKQPTSPFSLPSAQPQTSAPPSHSGPQNALFQQLQPSIQMPSEPLSAVPSSEELLALGWITKSPPPLNILSLQDIWKDAKEVEDQWASVERSDIANELATAATHNSDESNGSSLRQQADPHSEKLNFPGRGNTDEIGIDTTEDMDLDVTEEEDQHLATLHRADEYHRDHPNSPLHHQQTSSSPNVPENRTLDQPPKEANGAHLQEPRVDPSTHHHTAKTEDGSQTGEQLRHVLSKEVSHQTQDRTGDSKFEAGTIQLHNPNGSQAATSAIALARGDTSTPDDSGLSKDQIAMKQPTSQTRPTQLSSSRSRSPPHASKVNGNQKGASRQPPFRERTRLPPPPQLSPLLQNHRRQFPSPPPNYQGRRGAERNGRERAASPIRRFGRTADVSPVRRGGYGRYRGDYNRSPSPYRRYRALSPPSRPMSRSRSRSPPWDGYRGRLAQRRSVSPEPRSYPNGREWDHPGEYAARSPRYQSRYQVADQWDRRSPPYQASVRYWDIDHPHHPEYTARPRRSLSPRRRGVDYETRQPSPPTYERTTPYADSRPSHSDDRAWQQRTRDSPVRKADSGYPPLRGSVQARPPQEEVRGTSHPESKPIPESHQDAQISILSDRGSTKQRLDDARDGGRRSSHSMLEGFTVKKDPHAAPSEINLQQTTKRRRDGSTSPLDTPLIKSEEEPVVKRRRIEEHDEIERPTSAIQMQVAGAKPIEGLDLAPSPSAISSSIHGNRIWSRMAGNAAASPLQQSFGASTELPVTVPIQTAPSSTVVPDLAQRLSDRIEPGSVLTGNLASSASVTTPWTPHRPSLQERINPTHPQQSPMASPRSGGMVMDFGPRPRRISGPSSKPVARPEDQSPRPQVSLADRINSDDSTSARWHYASHSRVTSREGGQASFSQHVQSASIDTPSGPRALRASNGQETSTHSNNLLNRLN